MKLQDLDFSQRRDGLNAFVGIEKGDEVHVYRFSDRNPDATPDLLRQLNVQASANDITWYDAAILSQKLRHMKEVQRRKATDAMHRRMEGVDPSVQS